MQAGLWFRRQIWRSRRGRKLCCPAVRRLRKPLTQLIRIHDANRIAAAETAVSKAELKKAENQVALEVHKLYFNILITQLQKQAAEQQSMFAAENLREREKEVLNGSALKVAVTEGEAGLLESRQEFLTADLQLSDLSTALNDLLGLPLDTQVELDPEAPRSFEVRTRDEYVRIAWSQNPEIKGAEEQVRKAQAAVDAAKAAYIPDITAWARESYQNGVPFLVRNFGTVGVNLNWDLFDFGKRRAHIRERNTQLAEAEENLRRLKEEVEVGIRRSYNKLERTNSLVQVANQVVQLRQESERLAQNRLAQNVVLTSERRQATAAVYKARAEYLQANLGYLLSWAELQHAAGITPGL